MNHLAWYYMPIVLVVIFKEGILHKYIARDHIYCPHQGRVREGKVNVEYLSLICQIFYRQYTRCFPAWILHNYWHILCIYDLPIWILLVVHPCNDCIHFVNFISIMCLRENEASLAVLPDRLMEFDGMTEVCALTSLHHNDVSMQHYPN